MTPISIHGMNLPYVKGLSRKAWTTTVGEIRFRDFSSEVEVCIVAYQNNSCPSDMFAEVMYKDNGTWRLVGEEMLHALLKDKEEEHYIRVVDGRPRVYGIRFGWELDGFGIDACQMTHAYRLISTYGEQLAIAIKFWDKVKTADGILKVVDRLQKIEKFVKDMDKEQDNRVRGYENQIAWYKKQIENFDARHAVWHEEIRDSVAILRKFFVEFADKVEE
jgi:hypothetical protein